MPTHGGRAVVAVLLLANGCIARASAGDSELLGCQAELRTACTAAELNDFVSCSVCASLVPRCATLDTVGLCREAASAPDPQDPPFDLTRVLFSGSFSSHMVLQRAPQQSAAFGTGKPGGSVRVTLSGPGGFVHVATAAVADSSSDLAVHGTWKLLLPPRPAGFGYTLEAACDGCSNTSTTTLSDVGFGDVPAPANVHTVVVVLLNLSTAYHSVMYA